MTKWSLSSARGTRRIEGGIYSREFSAVGIDIFRLDRIVDGRGNWVFSDEVALCKFYFASDTALDGLTASPRRVGATR